MQYKYDPGLEIFDNRWLRLHRNENLFIDEKWLVKLAKKTIKSTNISYYPDPTCKRLRKKLSEIYKIDFDQIYIGNGSDEILADLFHYLRSRFSKAFTLPITYGVYPYLFQRYDYKHSILKQGQRCGFSVIDSPNSLTGEKIAIDNIFSTFLLWDNIYGEFANDVLNVDLIKHSSIILRSFSKFYGLANLRIGYGIANASIISDLMKKKDIYNVNGFAQEMALQVLDQKNYFDSLIPKIEQARTILQKELKALGFLHSNSQANFVWVTHPFISAKTIEKSLAKAHIAVRLFPEPSLNEYLRITIPPLEQIERVIQIIKKCT